MQTIFYPRADGSGSGAVQINGTSYPSAFTAGTGSGVQASTEIRTDLAAAYIWRCFFPIDTSALTANATVTAVTFSLYRNDNDSFSNTDSTSIVLVPNSQASNTSLATSDFGNITRTNKGSATFASTSVNSYVDITISDFSFISLTGYTKIAVMTKRDFDQSTPTGGNIFSFAGASDGTHPPKLTVTYTLPSNGAFLYNFV